MGTPSVIAAAAEQHGRYVHWDGYPTGVGQAILNIVRRDGLDKARDVLTREHFGWSSVTAEQANDEQRDSARFESIPGYGVAYSHTEHPDEWAQPVDSEEWGYVLEDDALRIVGHGHIPWNDTPEAQTAALKSIEGV